MPMFIKYVLISSVVSFALAFYPVYNFASSEQTISMLYGYVIALINIIMGYALIEYSIEKNVRMFMIIVFGGMMIRMVIVGVLMILTYYALKADIMSLVFSVMFFYFLFAAIEIYYLNKRKPKLKRI